MQIEPNNTTVVLLAAGHGKRMMPLTENTPKPLLKVAGLSLIEHHIIKLARLGFINIVINVAYLADQIMSALGDGSAYGVNIRYSDESSSGALETAGGLKKALPIIQSDPFITVNADIWTDYDFTHLLDSPPALAKLVMVNNPEHNPDGDFSLGPTGTLLEPNQLANNAQNISLNNTSDANKTLTFSGIAIYRKAVIENLKEGKCPLAPVFKQLISQGKLDGVKHNGVWEDIGTPERLELLRDRVPAD